MSSSFDKKLSDLDDLIALAEKATQTIDGLNTDIDKRRSQMLYQLMASYVALFLSAGFFLYTVEYMAKDVFRVPLQLITASFFLVLVFVFINTVLNRVKTIRRLRKDLETEVFIQSRLISLIDDQFKWVRNMMDMSPVSIAVIDMRIRRLERQLPLEVRKKAKDV